MDWIPPKSFPTSSKHDKTARFDHTKFLFKGFNILDRDTITFMSRLSYINHYTRSNQVFKGYIINMLTSSNTVCWCIYMRANACLHVDLLYTKGNPRANICIIYFNGLLKSTPTIPRWYVFIKPMSQINNFIRKGGHDVNFEIDK